MRLFVDTYICIYLLQLTQTVFLLINIGQNIRNSMSSSIVFWVLYLIIPGVSIFINSLIINSVPQTMGNYGGMLSLLSYGVLSLKSTKFLLFGQWKVTCFGLMLLEFISHVLIGYHNQYGYFFASSLVSWLFEAFLVSCFSVFVYKFVHPREVFPIKTIYEITWKSVIS